ncbi:MAG: hypothetical protein ACUVWZ_13670 [Anaerolineae bacterium]
MRPKKRGWAALFGVGWLSEAVYLAATIRLPWWRYGGRLWSWPELLGGGWGLAVCLAGIAVLMGVYLLGWFVVRQGWEDRRILWRFAGLFAVTLLWFMPITSDLFTYLTQSHLLTDLRANPYQVAPLDLSSDPLVLAYPTRYATRPSVYGPVWILLSAPGTLTRVDIVGGLFWLKGLAVVAYLGCARLVERILQQIRHTATVEGLYLFAWNPLVLLLGVGAGHNDMVMMALVLLAFWLAVNQHWVGAWMTLVLSIWVKYVSVIFFPLLILWTWKWAKEVSGLDPVQTCARGAVASALVSVLAFLPFWSPGLLPGIGQRLLQPINWAMGSLDQWIWALRIGLACFAAVYGILIRRLVRGDASFQRFVDTCFLLSLIVFGMGAARSQPWHLIWSITLASLASWRWAWPVVVGLAAIMLGAQVWVEWGAPGLKLLF